MIEIVNLKKSYGATAALRGISLSLPQNSVSCIMGLSGSGKSTLLRHINRLLEPDEGEVRIDGRNLADFDRKALQDLRRNRISMVFQHAALFPHMSVAENVAYGLKVKGLAQNEIDAAVAACLEEVGLAGAAGSRVQDLSGGMKQRVGIARAFAAGTDILLMDEPFSALDPVTRRSLQTLLSDLQRKWHKTIVFVTHDLEECRLLADYVVLMKEGQVVQTGTFGQLVRLPADDYVRSFMAGVQAQEAV